MTISNELPGSPLTDRDIEKLAASGIDRQLAEQAGLRRVTSLEGAEIVGDQRNRRNYAGILFPHFWPGDPSPRDYTLRRDEPEIEIRPDGTRHEKAKYLQPPGRRSLAYFPPGIDPTWLADGTMPVMITEGPKKTLALHALACHKLDKGDSRPRWLTVGIPGVWNFRGVIGKTIEPTGTPRDEKGLIPDLQRINSVNRHFTVAFDSNVRTNKNVRAARRGLTIELQQRGGHVSWLAPPTEPDVNGFDDLIGLWGPDRVLGYIYGGAQPVSKKKQRAEQPPTSPTRNDRTSEYHGEPFELTPEGIVWWRQTDTTCIPAHLTNFPVRIVAHIEKDDGIQKTSYLELEATVDEAPRRFTLTPKEFQASEWAIERLGPSAIIDSCRGSRERLREAIQRVSSGWQKRSVYTHTGWREINGHWVFLHAQGALGATGPLQNVEVEIDAKLGGYDLLSPPEGGELRRSVEASIRLLEVAPNKITVPLFATIWRAVLGECNFTIHLTGDTTAGKTSLAAVAQQHFGAAMHRDNLPASWLSTGNALEVRAFQVKDALMVVDDFVLGGTYRDRQRKIEDFDRLVRAQANRANRSRLRSDGNLAADRPPRALILSTGEDLPDRLSTLNRLLVLTLGKNDIRWDRLTEVQADAEEGLLAGAMSAYIRWLASQYHEVQRWVMLERKEQRQRCKQAGFQGRTVDLISELRLGLMIWARFAVESGALPAESIDRHQKTAQATLDELLRAQMRDQAELVPARRFIDLLRSALVGGDAFLATREGGVPPNAERCGWRSQASGYISGHHKIGWIDGDYVYLDPDLSYRAALELSRAMDQPLPLTPRTLGRALYESGFLEDDELNHRRSYCVRRICEGSECPVLYLRTTSLFRSSDEVLSADGADGGGEEPLALRQHGC